MNDKIYNYNGIETDIKTNRKTGRQTYRKNDALYYLFIASTLQHCGTTTKWPGADRIDT